MALVLASCGGGDGGNGGSGGSTNTAPAFSSAATASVAENSTTVAYQATATDAQGDAITFTISGGADASAFTITPGGALSFATPPNYDLPTDADGNNVYQVTLQASDGKASSTLAVSITVTNDREGISVTRVATGLTNPVGIASLEDGPMLAVALRDNTVMRVNGSTGTASTYYRVTDSIGNPSPGLTILGMTRALGFGQAKALYLLIAQGGTASIFCANCWNFAISEGVANVSDGTPVIIGAGPDQRPYVAVGDLPGNRAQDVSGGFTYGKIYRYVPSTDPYAGASPQFFNSTLVGIGLRSPAFLGTFPDSRLAVLDRGGSAFDELSVSNIASTITANFGWPYYEGTREMRAGGAGLSGLTMPSLAVPLGAQVRQSRGLVAGLAYTGWIKGIANHYLLAEKGGHIWSIPFARFDNGATPEARMLEARDEDFRPDAGSIDQPVGMTVDGNGTIYILDGDGELFRVNDGGGSIVISPVGP